MPRSPAALNDLTIQQFRSFCSVFEKQSYSQAARDSGMSVPGLWEQIRKLERRYGGTLFIRQGRRIQPTPVAERLYETIRPLLTGLASSLEILDDEEFGRSRSLTVISGVRILCEDLAPVLKAFSQEYPAVQLRFLHYSDQDASRLIANGDADLALTLQPGPGTTLGHVHTERAYRIEFLAVFLRKHPLRAIARPTLAEIVKYPLVCGHARTYVRQMFEHGLHRAGLSGEARFAAETDTSAFTDVCVRAGLGVGIIAGQPKGPLCRDLEQRSLSEQLGQAWVMMRWRQGRMLSPALKRLTDLVRENGRPAVSETV